MTRSEMLDTFAALATQWATRNGEYETARQRYYGTHWDAATNPEPANRYSLTLNYLKPFVDKSVQLLVGRVPALQVMPPGVDATARRHAENLEGILYGTWAKNDAPAVLQRVAWDSFVLRRGLLYSWWDPKARMVRFKAITPDTYYPDYDGEAPWRAMVVSRRSTERLKAEFPALASDIKQDSEMRFPVVTGSDLNRVHADGQTTVFDLFELDGGFTRMMGDAITTAKLDWDELPFYEFPCYPVSGTSEPLNMIDQLVELNQYLDQLVSQKADIIAKYANPTIIDKGSGVSAEAIRRTLSANGGVLPIRKDGSIELLNWQGTVPAIDEQMTFILDAMFDLAGKPRSSFGQTVTNQSGVVTNLALTPTLQSNEYHEAIWGQRLSEFNRCILRLWEKNMKGDLIAFEGRYDTQTGNSRYYKVQLTGGEINGWYENRIKWPSAVRTDDPVYVQNLLQQLTSDPPAISLYTYLEMAGREDVEAEIDRIEQQLEDPRLHPDRLTSAVGAASQIMQSGMPPGMEGFGPGMDSQVPDTGGGVDAFASSLEAGAQPNRDALVKSAKAR